MISPRHHRGSRAHLEDGGLHFAVHLHRQNARIEALIDQQREQVLVIQNELLGFLMATVEDRRNLPGTTQAAARTLPLLVRPGVGDEVE